MMVLLMTYRDKKCQKSKTQAIGDTRVCHRDAIFITLPLYDRYFPGIQNALVPAPNSSYCKDRKTTRQRLRKGSNQKKDSLQVVRQKWIFKDFKTERVQLPQIRTFRDWGL